MFFYVAHTTKSVSNLGWVFPNSNDLIIKIPKYAQIAWVVVGYRYIQIDNQDQRSQITSVFNLAQSKTTWEGTFSVGLEIVLVLPIEVERSFHGGWHHSLAEKELSTIMPALCYIIHCSLFLSVDAL